LVQPTQPATGCVPPPPVAAQCVNNIWVINSTQIANQSVVINSFTVVTGNFSITESTITLEAGTQLNITGCASFSGSTLIVNVSQAALNKQTNFTALSYGCLESNFSSIQVQSNSACDKIQIGQSFYQGNQLVLLLTPQNNCDYGFATWKIVVIVVVVVAVALGIGIITYLIRRSKKVTHSAIVLQALN